jgi:hypothetical protein
MLGHALVLFGIVLAGVFISCKVFAYEISHLRKAVAAGVFVVLNVIPIPIPLVSLLIPPVGLYIALMDDTHQRSEVNKVFALTFVFAIVGVLAVYLPQIS